MKGKPGADSSNLVTSQINGKTLIDLAAELFGAMPAFWGRYFTSVQSTGVVEYRHRKENQILRDNNIRVLPIARQTRRVLAEHKRKGPWTHSSTRKTFW